jgi:hypothetical protein
MDPAKMLKKLVMANRFTLEEISQTTGIPIREMPGVYKSYTSYEMPDTLFVVGHGDEITKLKALILAGEKVIIHGPPGCGKSISARKAIHDAGKNLNEINISEFRTPELLNSKLFGGHATQSNTCFLFEEVDNFYWRSHAAFNSILEDAVVPIVMTCNEIDRVPESVKKQCTVMRMFPPKLKDLQVFLDKKFPHLSLDAEKIYSPDFREVMRRILYDVRDERVPEKEYSAEGIAGVIVGERDPARRLAALQHPSDPLSWAINWVDGSAARLAPSMGALLSMLDGLSTVDSWVRRTKQAYVASMMAALPCFNRRVKLDFPAQLFAAEKKPKKAKVVDDGVTKVIIKKKEKTATVADTNGDF